jgi:8-oxo-dGTP diphosphatase
MQHVVIGIILNQEKQILISQRLAHQEKAGCWEFPGGKVELHEAAFQALQRELKEELAIQVLEAEKWMEVQYHYPHKSVLLDTWIIKKFTGDPQGAEGQPVKWCSALELSQLSFPEGNAAIIENLPDYLQKLL